MSVGVQFARAAVSQLPEKPEAPAFRPGSLTCINYEYRQASVWAVFYMTGETPPDTVDHVDRDTTNCKWANLRVASPSQQNCNQRLRIDNALGIKGVVKHQNGFRASVKFEGVLLRKAFSTIEEAIAFREAAAKGLHGQFYRSA